MNAALAAGVALGGVGGLLLHGPWALAGVAGGVAAALLAREVRGGPVAEGVAAFIPPLAASGPGAAAAAGALLLALAWFRTGSPWVLFAAPVGLLLPGPAGALLPAFAGAMLLAAGPWPRALLGAPLALAGWFAAPGALPAPAAMALLAGFAARGVAAHPANATMARRVLGLGLAGAPAPALAGFVFAAMRIGPSEPLPLFTAAMAACLLGLLWLAAHVGLALTLQSTDAGPALWLSVSWVFSGMVPAIVPVAGFRAAPEVVLSAAGLLAVPAALAGAWVLAGIRRGSKSARSPERFAHVNGDSVANRPTRP